MAVVVVYQAIVLYPIAEALPMSIMSTIDKMTLTKTMGRTTAFNERMNISPMSPSQSNTLAFVSASSGSQKLRPTPRAIPELAKTRTAKSGLRPRMPQPVEGVSPEDKIWWLNMDMRAKLERRDGVEFVNQFGSQQKFVRTFHISLQSNPKNWGGIGNYRGGEFSMVYFCTLEPRETRCEFWNIPYSETGREVYT